MTASRDGEPDEANSISYPSPGAEAMDAGPFYHTSTREPVQEHTEHHEQPAPEAVPVVEHEQTELQHQEADTSQHASRPPNLEELQLAAQLGQGLAGTSLMPATDPSMNVEDPSLRSIMPHPEPEQQQTPSYVHETPQPDPLAQHPIPVPLAPSPLQPPPQYAQQQPQQQQQPGENPRKRSKVSRACDECRRKKIKCDATSDTGDNPCSSCARASIRCLFSRVPQKRGPSKGYIKELADRIHSIENKLESDGSLNHEELERLFGPTRPSPQSNLPNSDETNRKRPFSSISTGDFTTPTAPRQAPWGSEPRSIQPSTAPSEGFSTAAYGNGSLAPQPQPAVPKTDGTPTKTPQAPMDVSMTESDDVPEVDEVLLDEYLANVQPVFPILPYSKTRLQTLLAQSPTQVRTAFSTALLAAVQPSSGDVKLASALLNDWESSDGLRSQAGNIVHAQTLLLLIIDADWRASASLPFLISRAVALANTMKLWRYTPVESATDPDSDEQLCVRLWWSLVLMDRWHAAGTGKPAQIPDSSVVAPPGLDRILGEVCFHLIRLSKLLNRISFVITTLQAGASTTEPALAGILADYIENYREDLPGHIEPATYPLVHLAYWHCRLLVSHLDPGAAPSEITWPTKELANLLSANAHMRTPLINHFVSLVAMSLGKLSRLESSREEAGQIIRDIVDKPAGLWDSVRDKLSEQLRPQSAAEATASQGLQHLADLATAHEVIAPGGEDISFGPSLSSGYLEVQ